MYECPLTITVARTALLVIVPDDDAPPVATRSQQSCARSCVKILVRYHARIPITIRVVPVRKFSSCEEIWRQSGP